MKPDADNASKVLAALKRFGSPLHSVTPGDFTVKGTIFQIGVVPRWIYILTAITGVEFDEARQDCLNVEIDGLTVPVLSIDKIIRNKEATGREKDVLDAKNLRRKLK